MGKGAGVSHLDLVLAAAGEAAIEAVRSFRHDVGLFDYEGSHPRFVIRDLAAEQVAARRGESVDCLYAGDDAAAAKREYERIRAVHVGRAVYNALRAAETLEKVDFGEDSW